MTAFDAISLHDPRRSTSGAPLALRLRVRLTRGRLDRKIAAGVRCDSTRAVALRAQQLTHQQTRRQIAGQLRAVVNYAERHRSGRTVSAVMIDVAAVMVGRHAILGLAERLAGAVPASPAGVALTEVLLSDGLSPLFDRNCERTVIQAIWEIEDALEVRGFDSIAPRSPSPSNDDGFLAT
jgi:hypothetical protein